MDLPVAIIGAGLAGLCCGRRLSEIGIRFRIFEASDCVGGRVRTDDIDGFKLDRGFQIYLPSYSEGRRVLDYAALDLRPFARGANVRFNGRFHRVADPRAEFGTALKSIFGPIGSPSDKFKLISFLNQMLKADPSVATDQPAIDLLRFAGFSDQMIDRLFRPFLGGVFLEKELATSARFFRFVFQQFASGPGTIPANGMRAIPDMIASRLPVAAVTLNSPVRSIGPGHVELTSGESIEARAVIVATDALVAKRLLGEVPDDPIQTSSRGTVTLYYATATPPMNDAMLAINGDGDGPVNSIVNMTACSSTYSPPGQSLLSVSVVGLPIDDDKALQHAVRSQLTQWYGASVSTWRHVASYRIPYALPDMSVGEVDPWQRPVRIRPGLYVCGDHRDQGSINGAMESGHRAAQAVADDLSNQRV